MPNPDDGKHSRYWTSPEGVSLLNCAYRVLQDEYNNTLRAGTLLRKQHHSCPPERIAQALEFALLRQKALHLGYMQPGEPLAAFGLFTRQSLEQSTSPAIAAHHALRFAHCRHILEICTGAGFDTAALARIVQPNGGIVWTIESDEHLAEFARHNLRVQNIMNVEVLTGRAEDIVPTLDCSSVDGIWCDPSRRYSHDHTSQRFTHHNTEERIYHPDDYHPPLRYIEALMARLQHQYTNPEHPADGLNRTPKHAHTTITVGVKVSPALTLPATWKREWIGYRHECREQVLWYNAHDVHDGMVSLVDAQEQWIPPTKVSHPLSASGSPLTVSVGGDFYRDLGWLIEPHAALIRSGLLAEFFAERGVALIDEHIAYGRVATELPPSAFYQQFRILEEFPFHRKHLRERLRQYGWGMRTEIKKRGFPETPEQIRSWLGLQKSKHAPFGVVVITRIGAKHHVFMAERHSS